MIRRKLFSLMPCMALVLLMSPFNVSAQDLESVEPFKVGTFAIDDVPTVGLVLLDDQLIVELEAANRAMELLPQYSNLAMPEDEVLLVVHTRRVRKDVQLAVGLDDMGHLESRAFTFQRLAQVREQARDCVAVAQQLGGLA